QRGHSFRLQEMGDVKVIGAILSLFCTRVEWALKLKGVEYEYMPEDLRNKSELLLKNNPVHKKVPVLLHNGKPIAESLVIVEYIDEAWKENPLLSQEPYERAQARFWARYSDELVMVVFNACKSQGEDKVKAIETALKSLAFIEKEITGKKFFGGDEIGFFDLAMGWISYWLNVMEEVGDMKLLVADKFPSLHEWTQNFAQVPLIKECLPPRDKLVEYFTASVTYLRSLAAQSP
ncbi:Glutathione S-transferase, C-terminal, partial [Dillenia turbinata]